MAIVATSNGQVRGVDLGEALAWRGIPYAQPPTGPLRHRPPLPPSPWIGVRDATAFGARAMQTVLPAGVIPGPRPAAVDDPQRMSEDCLYVNVCAPARPSATPRPVFVWIHGGGYMTGAGPDGIGDGETFVRNHDVVVVTFNYRLGAFGFFDDTNCGVLDQVAALRWVRDNIAAFGGDPRQVTVGGVSAGAKSVATLMAVPAAAGLFQRAISQSGGGDHVTTAAVARATADRLGIDRRRIPVVPAGELLAAQQTVSPPMYGVWTWRPVVGGSVLPDVPVRRIASGSAAKVALLASSAVNEAGTFVGLDPRAALPAPRVLTEAFGPARAGEILAVYGDDLVGVMTDERYGIPTLRLVDAQSRYAPTWRYLFDGALPGAVRAAHGTDVVFAWAVGGGDLGDPAATSLSQTMHAAWGSFVRDGKAPWTPYDTTSRPTMIMASPPRLEDDPASARRQAWGDLTWPSGTWF
ncbi:carboxylesterase/lipase family protein [Kutzneria sp. 744]|uniref:carboxylesterase/lipase family protein n=1 Tax=Kutzneria sp. (strain 744) TaxID=345341 RepID=UPI0003EEC6DE|nr:carboxylesterase family protein [Kutzneria sp. 744]EWM11580.1 para-nitrobenzyl esterase [Kutzneria sp. 744]